MNHPLHNRILDAGLAVAERDGWWTITRDGVAREAGVGHGSVNLAFGTVDALRDAVMAYAVRLAVLPVIAQGLAAGHQAARDAPDELRRAAANGLLTDPS